MNSFGFLTREDMAKRLSYGVLIEDVDGNLWNHDRWDGSVCANSIAVIDAKHNFKLALTQYSQIRMDDSRQALWTSFLKSPKIYDYVISDYNGNYDTQEIWRFNSWGEYAASLCISYRAPDNNRNWYLPSLGELNLAYQYKKDINKALSVCGGDAMHEKKSFYWSSNYCETNYDKLMADGFGGDAAWGFSWNDGQCKEINVWKWCCVRPFAPFEF